MRRVDDALVDVSNDVSNEVSGNVLVGAAIDPMSESPRRSGRSLMARAVDLLSRREHSRIQLGRKLQRHLGPDEDASAIERVLDELQADQLLSDARFAASVVRQRASRYGDRRLAHDLRERGVGAADIATAMTQVAGTEPRRALAAWSRRFDTLPASAEERGRQGRYLQARGFSMDIITQVLAGKVEAID